MSNIRHIVLDYITSLVYTGSMNQYRRELKEIRIEKSFTQAQVAKAIGVSRPTYSAIEAGTQELSLDEASKLASLYGISVQDLLSGSVPDIEKYKHMILTYLRMNLSKDGRVPKTKLAKLLYFADFAWFYDHLESMSGMQYRKIPYGPVPDTFFRVLDELAEDGKVNIDTESHGDKVMFLVSEAESNKNERIQTLSVQEKALMKKIAEKWKNKKTQEIVNFTHNQLPYFLCRDNELIPYELITQEDGDAVY